MTKVGSRVGALAEGAELLQGAANEDGVRAEDLKGLKHVPALLSCEAARRLRLTG